MLETFAIKNFKLLKDQLFHLSNLTVFSGLNSMGKSSVIQSLLLLRQSYEKNMLPGKGLSLMGDYVQIGNGADVLSISAENETIEYDLFWENNVSLSLTFLCNKASNVSTLEKESGDGYQQALFTSAFQYLAAKRISPKSAFEVSDYDVKELNSIGIMGEYTVHFIAEKGLETLAIKALRHPKAVSHTLIASINAWMSEITPGTRVIAKLIPEINQASLHYQFETSQDHTKSFRPENVGFGLTYVLPIVTAVLNAKPGDFLIFENPESHLHPAGQSAIAKLIALASENSVQILIETHSDHFLNGVRIAVKKGDLSANHVELYYLSKDIESNDYVAQVSNPRIDSAGKIDHWPSGFFDEWDNSLDALLDED